MWNIYIYMNISGWLDFFYNFNHRVVLGLTIVIGGYGLFDNWRTSTKMKLRTSGPCGGNISLLSIEFRLNIWVLGQEVKDQPEKSRVFDAFSPHVGWWSHHKVISQVKSDFPGEIRMLNQIARHPQMAVWEELISGEWIIINQPDICLLEYPLPIKTGKLVL